VREDVNRRNPDGSTPLQWAVYSGNVAEVKRLSGLDVPRPELKRVLGHLGFFLAGTGETGHTGDGGPAKLARLAGPKGVAWAPDGSLYLADTESHTIRRIDLKSGIISTVAGAAERGDGPDGPATRCRLARPHGVDRCWDRGSRGGDEKARARREQRRVIWKALRFDREAVVLLAVRLRRPHVLAVRIGGREDRAEEPVERGRCLRLDTGPRPSLRAR